MRTWSLNLSVAIFLAACSYDWRQKPQHFDGGAVGDAAPDATPDADSSDASCAASELHTFYRDQDGDGFGGDERISSCTAPDGYVDRTGDCDDATRATYPGAPDLCNGIDDDCNPDTDDGLASCNGYRCDGVKCRIGCTVDEECVATLFCRDNACHGLLSVGTACKDDLYCESAICECASADCSERRCAESRCPDCQFVETNGAGCNGTIDGVEHGKCTGSSVCQAGACKGENGGDCAQDAECISGSCDANGKCAAPAGLGETCNSAPDCRGDLQCESGKCLSPNGVTCPKDDDCASGSCSASGICGNPQDLGQSCNSESDCIGTLVCSTESPRACRRPPGSTCTSDGQCVTGSCGAIPNRFCQHPGQLNAACDSHGDCSGNLICHGGGYPVGVCKVRVGDSCTSTNQCGIYCGAGTCNPQEQSDPCTFDEECFFPQERCLHGACE